MTKTKSYRQLRYVFLLAKKCKISNESLKNLVNDNFPDTEGHLSKLNAFQAFLLINILKRILNGQSEYPSPSTVEGEGDNYRLGRQPRTESRPPMSQAQHDNCFNLAHEIIELRKGATPENNETASDLLEKLARHHGAICFDLCTTRQAWRVQSALKSIKQRIMKIMLDKR
jgi:hypothetical protein